MLLAVGKSFHPLGMLLVVLVASLHRCDADYFKVTVTPGITTYQNKTSSGYAEPYPKAYNSPGFMLSEGWDTETIGDWVASSDNYNNLADPYPDALYPSPDKPYAFDAQRIVLHNRGSCNLPDDGVYTRITKSIFLEAGKYSITANVVQRTSLKPLCGTGISGSGQTGIEINGVAMGTSIHNDVEGFCRDFTIASGLYTIFDVSASGVTNITVYLFSSPCADNISYVDDILVKEIIAPSAPLSSILSSLPSVSSLPSQSPSALPSSAPSSPPSSEPSVLKKHTTPVKGCLWEAMVHVKCGCKDTVGPRCFHQVNTKHCLKDFKKKHPHSTPKQQGDFQQKNQKAYERECKTQKEQGLLGAPAGCLTC
jgi:hypothetical protein